MLFKLCIVVLVAVHLSRGTPAVSDVHDDGHDDVLNDLHDDVPGDLPAYGDVHFDFVFPNLTDLEERSSRSSVGNRGDKMYAVSAFIKVNWYTAQHICSFQGMTLASITSLVEQERLYRYLSVNGYNNNNELFWLGGSDLASHGVWQWTTNGRPLTYTNFERGEPNNNGGQEHCLVIHSNGKWHDYRCDRTFFFICENRCPLNSYEVPFLKR